MISRLPEGRISNILNSFRSGRVERNREKGDKIAGVTGGENNASKPPNSEPNSSPVRISNDVMKVQRLGDQRSKYLLGKIHNYLITIIDINIVDIQI